ncbi:plasmid mobilization relaxosome protein MobC [Dyadobacter chenwenxiniae]|uniref:Plasmid mobilization relaxosome protein MobC n=1 Tax=Dyadobacter chenwenxiniae TaxID=2906456 RepID=A0A9X1PT89_9BACT|nr:plasmid mobilization relaxosome protein MobC [Dyadobacter chenwenxiniae]MCF0065669.1 plasmid mobilization relaxosome protein MobC [Dyadobacter chenwenxiniae]UON85577.1 plasmid mobilization relaxosome protein MobC [Dyadobacter chenwenxiniae]
MEGKETNKTERVTLRLTPGELAQINKKCKSSTCRKLSEYMRLVLLSKPVSVVTRDRSADDLMLEVTKLRVELSRLGNNSNQATKRLHTLSQISEFRSHLEQQNSHNEEILWVLEQVKSIINKLADQWLQ